MGLQINNGLFFAEVERLLAAGESVTIKVRGYSMMPWLRDGEHSVVVSSHREEDIKIGNILFFTYRDNWIMHRLCAIRGDELVFAGDGNYKQQEVVERNAVKGVVTAVITPSGRLIKCDSWLWRFRVKLWLCMPALVRRYVLGALRRLKL